MELARRSYGAGGEPDIRAGDALHGRTRVAIDLKTRMGSGRANGPDKIRAFAHPGRTVIQRIFVKRIDKSVLEFGGGGLFREVHQRAERNVFGGEGGRSEGEEETDCAHRVLRVSSY